MAASAVLKTTSYTTGVTNGSPLTVSVTGVTAGNALVLCSVCDTGGDLFSAGTIKLDTTTLTLTTQGKFNTGAGTTFVTAIGYRLAVGAGSHSFVITPSTGAGSSIGCWVYEVTNISGFDIDGGQAWNGASSTTLALPVIASTGKGIAFFVAACAQTGSATGTGGWQGQTAQNGNVSGYLVHTGGNITPGFTQSPSGTYMAVNASFLASPDADVTMIVNLSIS